MVWHLLITSPGNFEVPATHRYRDISHDEFRNMAVYLEEYVESGKIWVRDSLHGLILRRLAKLDIRSDIDGPDAYSHRIMPRLKPNDFVLVLCPLSDGMYIHIKYATAPNHTFQQMVQTGLIEPIDSKVTQPIRVRTRANEIVALNKRIAEAEKILQEGSINGQTINPGRIQCILDEIKKEKEKLVKDETLGNVDEIVNLILLYKARKEAALSSKEELTLRLHIERNVNDNAEQQGILVENLKIIEKRIAICDEAIASLQSLLAEL